MSGYFSSDTFDELTGLYEDLHYQQLYQKTRDLWADPGMVDRLSVEELVLAARVAMRLGGNRLGTHLLMQSWNRDPDHVLNQVFARPEIFPSNRLIDDIRRLERDEHLVRDDPKLHRLWLIRRAMSYSQCRGFDLAHQLLDEAASLTDDPWLSANRADVFFAEDRWEESLGLVDRLFDQGFHHPQVAALVGRLLQRARSAEEAVERLDVMDRQSECYLVTVYYLWNLMAMAERQAHRRHDLAELAWSRCQRMEELAPLACRNTRSLFAHIRTDIALALEDAGRIDLYADGVRSKFFKRYVEIRRQTTSGEIRVLDYRPVFQKHVTCLPSSVASVAGHFGRVLDADRLARELTFSGTASWRMTERLREEGFAVKPFLLDAELAATLIEADLPFVYMYRYVGGAHATAMVGIDERGRAMIVHDPGGTRWDKVLLEDLDKTEAPVGPMCLALAPAGQAGRLEVIPDESVEFAEAIEASLKYRETGQVDRLAEVVERMEASHGDHPVTRWLSASLCRHRGDPVGAIDLLSKLLEQHPHCIMLQEELLGALHSSGNTALIRDTLARIVREGTFVGARESSFARRPAPDYVAQYADYLGLSQAGYDEAETLIRRTWRYAPYSAELYHNYADILLRQDRITEAVLPMTLATWLDPFNDHYARQAADVLHRTGRGEEALALLEARCRRYGQTRQGGSAWLTLIDTLEDYGFPERAATEMESVESRFADEATVVAYAVSFWCRRGRPDAAERALQRIDRSERPGAYLAAAVDYHRGRGNWQRALELAGRWVEVEPTSLDAHGNLLRLVAKRDGRKSALEMSHRWMQEHEADERYEELYMEWLGACGRDEQSRAVLRERVGRNPYDHDAWCRLGHRVIGELSVRPDDREERRRLEEILQRCRVLGPESTGTRMLQGRAHQHDGRWDEAIEQYLAVLRSEPWREDCYRQAWQCAMALSPERIEQVLAELETALYRIPGQHYPARELAMAVARRMGVERALEHIKKWSTDLPDDPRLVEAEADLLLDYGRGRPDAARARLLLREALERYPGDVPLRLSAAQAARALLDTAGAMDQLWDIIARYPLDTNSRAKLAWMLHEKGDNDEAVCLLEEAVAFDPLDERAWEQLAVMLVNVGRPDDAVTRLEEALAANPEHVWLVEQAIGMLLDLGRPHRAVAAARRLVEEYPKGSYCLYLLARAMHVSNEHTDLSEIETHLRRSLELKPGLYDSVDLLVEVLGLQRRYDEAERVLNDAEPYQQHLEALRSSRATLYWGQGRFDEAIGLLKQNVQDNPQYAWAWWTLLSWLEQRDEKEQLKDLLSNVPAPLMEDPDFASRRLELLAFAGTDVETLDAEWTRLLDDFPREERVHNDRFDALVERKQHDRALEVIEGIERFAPGSIFVLARKACVLALLGRFDQAFEVALKVWTHPNRESHWPDKVVWDTLEQCRIDDRGARIVYSTLMDGTWVRPVTFDRALEVLPMLDRKRSFFSVGANSSLPPNLTCLKNLLGYLPQAPFDAAVHIGAVLQALADNDGTRVALRFIRKHEAMCRQSLPLLQQAVYVFGTCSRPRYGQVLDWLSDWRSLEGLAMWVMFYYVSALRKTGGFADGTRASGGSSIIETERDMLEHLHPDHTLRWHVCMLLQGYLRAGLDDAFREVLQRYRGVVEDNEYWIYKDDTWLPTVCLGAAQVMDAESSAAVRAGGRTLFADGAASRAWVHRVWKRLSAGRLGRWDTFVAGLGRHLRRVGAIMAMKW